MVLVVVGGSSSRLVSSILLLQEIYLLLHFFQYCNNLLLPKGVAIILHYIEQYFVNYPSIKVIFQREKIEFLKSLIMNVDHLGVLNASVYTVLRK